MSPVFILRLGCELLMSLIAPPRCAACSAHVGMRYVFCSPCARSVVQSNPLGSGDVAAFVYGGAVARAIVRLKYGPEPHLARPLGELMRRGALRLGPYVPDVVVPVPLFGTRLVERGFNQAALLAAPVARDFGVPLLARALVRTRDTPQQALLDRRRRLVNMKRAFAARDPPSLRGTRVLLVDDVRTTGATLRACEEALHEAGARAVRSLVLAAVAT